MNIYFFGVSATSSTLASLACLIAGEIAMATYLLVLGGVCTQVFINELRKK